MKEMLRLHYSGCNGDKRAGVTEVYGKFYATFWNAKVNTTIQGDIKEFPSRDEALRFAVEYLGGYEQLALSF